MLILASMAACNIPIPKQGDKKPLVTKKPNLATSTKNAMAPSTGNNN